MNIFFASRGDCCLGVSVGILADDIKLHRPSDRGIGEVASVRFAQKTR